MRTGPYHSRGAQRDSSEGVVVVTQRLRLASTKPEGVIWRNLEGDGLETLQPAQIHNAGGHVCDAFEQRQAVEPQRLVFGHHEHLVEEGRYWLDQGKERGE